MSARSIKKRRHNFLAEGLINLPNSGAPFFSSRWTLEFLEYGNGINQRRPKASHRPIPSHATPAKTHANKSKIILNNIHCLAICYMQCYIANGRMWASCDSKQSSKFQLDKQNITSWLIFVLQSNGLHTSRSLLKIYIRSARGNSLKSRWFR
jgi:hypothetical protein